jgi:hypothetical protein
MMFSGTTPGSPGRPAIADPSFVDRPHPDQNDAMPGDFTLEFPLEYPEILLPPEVADTLSAANSEIRPLG